MPRFSCGRDARALRTCCETPDSGATLEVVTSNQSDPRKGRGGRGAHFRKALGMSQRVLAAAMGRSES